MTRMSSEAARVVEGVKKAAEAPKAVQPPAAAPFRIDWAVRCVEAYADAAPAPEIPGCVVVPAITVSRDNWLKYRAEMEREVLRVCGAFKDMRPLIAIDDERMVEKKPVDWRRERFDVGAGADLWRMLEQVKAAFPWGNVMLRGPYQATANAWNLEGDDWRKQQEANNHPCFGDWIEGTGTVIGSREGAWDGGFCPTMYLEQAEFPGPQWEVRNLHEYGRVIRYHHQDPRRVHPMVSPFVRGRWDKGPVSSVRMLQILRSIAYAKFMDDRYVSRAASVVVWGYVGHKADAGDQAAEAWKRVMPAFVNQLRIAFGGQVGTARHAGGGGGGMQA